MKKPIIISSPDEVNQEAEIINHLFEMHLDLFHIRKPHFSEEEMVKLLSKIRVEYRNKIVLHSHHYLANKYGISRLHFNTEKRIKTSDDEFESLLQNNYILSTSVHSIKEFNELKLCFEYAFISPVFDSISKSNYSAINIKLNERSNHHTQLIALGGIAKENYLNALDMGYDGVAFHGSVWREEKPLAYCDFLITH